jgi:hypothetical protein
MIYDHAGMASVIPLRSKIYDLMYNIGSPPKRGGFLRHPADGVLHG